MRRLWGRSPDLRRASNPGGPEAADGSEVRPGRGCLPYGTWSQAWRGATALLGAIAGAVLVAALLLDAASLERGFLTGLPQCTARQAGGSCAACGLSHSFIALAHGRFDEARRHNSFGPPVFAGFVLLAAAGTRFTAFFLRSYLRTRTSGSYLRVAELAKLRRHL